MDEPFDLPVTYKGQELLFPARLHQPGYTHRFVVDVYGQEVYFEPDEEGNYRAAVDPEQLQDKKIGIELLKTVVAALESIVR